MYSILSSPINLTCSTSEELVGRDRLLSQSVVQDIAAASGVDITPH
jgi:hypothetical protein